jgi:hypothetical protein
MKYYITDIETGIAIEVSKEVKEAYDKRIAAVWARIVLKLNEAPVGKMIIYGTGGGEDFKKDWEQMFYNPEPIEKPFNVIWYEEATKFPSKEQIEAFKPMLEEIKSRQTLWLDTSNEAKKEQADKDIKPKKE